MRVLVVQADRDSGQMVQSVFGALGHGHSRVDNVPEAWEILVRGGVDVVVAESEVAGLSTVDLCRRVRGQPGIAYPYFILLTGGGDDDALTIRQAGVDEHLLNPPSGNDLQASLLTAQRVVGLHRDLASAHRELNENRSELEAVTYGLVEAGHRDLLTGLSSRQHLNDDIGGIQSRLDRYGHRFSIALLDMDHFTAYNDAHGEQAGDRLLVEVGRAIAAEIRPGDSAYRYGGEEFLIVYPDQRLGTATVGAERLRRRVAQIATLAKLPGPGTLSAGIAEAGRTDHFEEVVKRADYALHQAKQAGRNRVAVEPNV